MDKLAVLCMTIGLVFFTLADTEVNPNFELFGVLMVSSALVADAVIGNVQEKAMNTARSSNVEMVLYSYSIGFVYILVWEVFVSQRFFQAIEFCADVSIKLSNLAKIFIRFILFFLSILKKPMVIFLFIRFLATLVSMPF